MKPAASGSFQLDNVLQDPCTKPYFVGGGLWGQANTLWPVNPSSLHLILYVLISPLMRLDTPLVRRGCQAEG